MVFLSSQVKLENLPSTKEEIYKRYDWFLFTIMIKTKNIKHDEELYSMYNRLQWYPLIHKETLFNYMMTDDYYFKSNLYKTMKGMAEIAWMEKCNNVELANDRKIIIPEEKKIFKEKDIMDMFDYFKRNNFKENPICQYVLPNQLFNQ